MEVDDFEMYLFTCSNCFCEQYISYAKSNTDADRHICPKCQTAYWWSPKQQKLYLELSETEVPETYMIKL